MASVNKVILIGNLGQDPEVRTFQNGGKIVNLSVACSESWRDRNTGERKERTEWVPVSIQNEGAAKYAEQYLRKGAAVYIEGQFRTRKWQDQNGNDRYRVEVVVPPFGGAVQAVGRREDSGSESRGDGRGGHGGGAGRGDYAQSPGPRDRAQSGSGYGAGGRSTGHGDIDDEIPFAPEFRV